MGRTTKKDVSRLRSEEKARKALSLRLSGLDFDKIAAKVGYTNRSGAWKAVNNLLAERRHESEQEAKELLVVELDRVDAMLVAVWDSALKGNLQAVDRVIKLLERRAKYLGLDAPARSEVSGPDGGPLQIEDAREQLIAAITKLACEHPTGDSQEGDTVSPE